MIVLKLVSHYNNITGFSAIFMNRLQLLFVFLELSLGATKDFMQLDAPFNPNKINANGNIGFGVFEAQWRNKPAIE